MTETVVRPGTNAEAESWENQLLGSAQAKDEIDTGLNIRRQSAIPTINASYGST